MIYLRLLFESFRFAWTALKVNPLRTILSLGGVTVGIFSIIAVLSVVDSLERSVKGSFDFLGTDVIYIEKWPWIGSFNFPWWEYLKRPESSYEEFKFLQENVKKAEALIIIAGRSNATLKRKSSSKSRVQVTGTTFQHDKLFVMRFQDGRYFQENEVERGANVMLIGNKIKDHFFPNESAIGKDLKLKGIRFKIIGELEEEGESFLNIPSNDDAVVIPYAAFRKLYETGGPRSPIGSSIGVKGSETDEGLKELESELTGLMRSKRGLSPTEDKNFELNRPEALSREIESVFGVLTIVGWVIGGFSIIIGAFGIANIMFVSVKERTPIIGIQKSLGAKNYFILYQFLFEAVYLSALGGLIGLFIVYLITFIPLGKLSVQLSVGNIALGLFISSIVGILSGIIPAMSAARMNPVIAIRAN